MWKNPAVPPGFSFALTLHPVHDTPDARCMGFSQARRFSLQHDLGVIQLNSILTFTSWGQGQMPQAEGSVTRDGPHPTADASPESTMSSVLLTDRLSIWDSHNPLLGFD